MLKKDYRYYTHCVNFVTTVSFTGDVNSSSRRSNNKTFHILEGTPLPLFQGRLSILLCNLSYRKEPVDPIYVGRHELRCPIIRSLPLFDVLGPNI